VLKLSQPLSIADGTRVEIIVVSVKVSENFTAREILAKLAALPLEGSGDEFSGQDHDKILY
jgi:predicted DNA-binding antitoxin AbrB/MazE fold protein